MIYYSILESIGQRKSEVKLPHTASICSYTDLMNSVYRYIA